MHLDDEDPAMAAPVPMPPDEVKEPGWYVAAVSVAAGLVAIWALYVWLPAAT